MYSIRQLLALLPLILAFTICDVHAADASKSHPHGGKVPPFKPGDPKVKLNEKVRSVCQLYTGGFRGGAQDNGRHHI